MNDKRMNNFGSAPGTFQAFTVKQVTSQSMGRIYLAWLSHGLSVYRFFNTMNI